MGYNESACRQPGTEGVDLRELRWHLIRRKTQPPVHVLADVDFGDLRCCRRRIRPVKQLPDEHDVFREELSPALDLHELAGRATAAEHAVSQSPRVFHAEDRLVVLALSD